MPADRPEGRARHGGGADRGRGAGDSDAARPGGDRAARLPRRVRLMRRLSGNCRRRGAGSRGYRGSRCRARTALRLLADHYVPLADEGRGTILVRTPYGRGFPWAHLYGVAFAEQGFHVLLQSCRGTGGSTGRFEPFRHEAADGQATVGWLRGQDWFTGRLGTIGASYLGYVQLALAGDPPPELKAAVVQVGIHDPAAFVYPGGVFALANVMAATAAAFSSRGVLRATRAVLRLALRWKRVSRVLPIRQACREALGEPVPYLEEWLDHEDPDDAYWRDIRLDLTHLTHWRVPTAVQGGWYDAALDQTLAQYAALRANGCEVSLLVGPWSHSSAFSKDGLVRVSREALAWMTERLAGDSGADEPRAPVRIHVGGTAQWRDLQAWPPHDASQAWYLDGDGELSRRCSRPHRVLVVPVRPRGPDPLGRRPADVPASRATRQRRAGGAARRPGFHQRAAAGPAGRARRGPGRALPADQHRLCARLRATLRRRLRRTVAERNGRHPQARARYFRTGSRHRADESTAYQFAPGAQAPVAGQRRRVFALRA